ncbi:MAG TPA: hypothetical protein VEA58_08540 [Anaerovoracaceae bacterium]|nr:hypothetical protein [Anaerovoracaceae bacterium]
MSLPKPKAENPLLMKSVNLFDISTWISGILFVVMFGIVVAMGSKVLSVIDNKVPGNQTPSGIPGYQAPVVGSGFPVV